jgi:hypothetical protein
MDRICLTNIKLEKISKSEYLKVEQAFALLMVTIPVWTQEEEEKDFLNPPGNFPGLLAHIVSK